MNLAQADKGLDDAEAVHVEKERARKQRELMAARKDLIDQLNDLHPQFEDALRQGETGFREGVGAILRARELADEMRARLNALLADKPKAEKSIPLGKYDFEMRLSGRIVAILSALAHPGDSFGNLKWHSTGIYLESDNWVGKENRLLKPYLREFLKNDEATRED